MLLHALQMFNVLLRAMMIRLVFLFESKAIFYFMRIIKYYFFQRLPTKLAENGAKMKKHILFKDDVIVDKRPIFKSV